jgi:predicted enzyme related to lactoylglutathione lyase
MEDETGAYADFTMKDAGGNNAAGVCHARGYNADLPPQWILYFNVKDPGESVRRCQELGGKVLREQGDGEGNLVYALIQDPAGAVVALMKA